MCIFLDSVVSLNSRNSHALVTNLLPYQASYTVTQPVLYCETNFSSFGSLHLVFKGYIHIIIIIIIIITIIIIIIVVVIVLGR